MLLWSLVACTAKGPGGADTGADTASLPATDDPYADPARWLCRPDRDGDPCDDNLDVTAVAADGTVEVVPHRPAEDPVADCFYVYPTTSLDDTPQADLEAGPEERFVVTIQAARYGAVCRLFAPLYRQVSVQGLFTDSGDFDLAYADVVDAFRSWRARDGGDRPFVLIGHSQGSMHLTRLIAEEIEPDPALHVRMVAAHLIGGFVTVPEGADVGGSFAATPVCRAPDQTGCVVHYNAYRADDPPGADAVFARSPVPGQQVVCAHPAALGGGSAPLGVVMPADAPPEVAALLGDQPGPFADPEGAPPLQTPFFSVPGLVSGACAAGDGASYLAVTVDADPADPRADDIGGDLLPGWGLHLVDVSLTQLDLVALAEAQIAAWSASGR